MLKKLKKIKLFTWLKTSLFLSAICGLLSVGCFLHDRTKHIERVFADSSSPAQMYSVFDTGYVDSYLDYMLSPGDHSVERTVHLTYKYRYQLLCLEQSGSLSFSTRIFLVYDTCWVSHTYVSTPINYFTIMPYEPNYLPGHETMTFTTGWFSDIPNVASFYLCGIYDGGSSPRDDTDCMYQTTNDIHSDFYEPFTVDSMFMDSSSLVNETNTVYQAIMFEPGIGRNQLMFDVTSRLSEISLLDIYYQRGYQDGYSQGYGEGYINGEEVGSSDSFNDGYSQGAYNGYQQGLEDGFQNAQQSLDQYWNQGYGAGFSDGYNEGFSSDSTATTIFNGILTIGMVPINVFLAMFNFEILGINLSAFIKGLLTVCLTIIVVRTVMGGKGGSDK